MDRRYENSGSPILLIGAQRSGTTALGLSLSSAAAACGGVFTVNGKLPYYLKRWWLDDTEWRHGRADEVIYSLFRRRPLGVGAEEWLARAETGLRASSKRIAEFGPKLDPYEEMRTICRTAYANSGIWGDKYNEYLLDLPFLDCLFPTATYIFLAREPSQSVASMINWDGDRPWNPRASDLCAFKWASWNRMWLEFRASIPRERRVELCYDDIDHQAVSDRLSIAFGGDVSPYMANYQPRVHPEAKLVELPALAIEVWASLRLCFQGHL